MDTFTKRVITIVLITLALIGITGYVGYRLYQYAIKDATQKIKSNISKGVQEGVGGILNPLTLPAKLFGGK